MTQLNKWSLVTVVQTLTLSQTKCFSAVVVRPPKLMFPRFGFNHDPFGRSSWKLCLHHSLSASSILRCLNYIKNFSKPLFSIKNSSTPGEQRHYCVWTRESYEAPCRSELFSQTRKEGKEKRFLIISSVTYKLVEATRVKITCIFCFRDTG